MAKGSNAIKYFTVLLCILCKFTLNSVWAQLTVQVNSRDSLVKTIIETKIIDSVPSEVSTTYTHVWINSINYKNEGNKDIILLLSKWQILEQNQLQKSLSSYHNGLLFYNANLGSLKDLPTDTTKYSFEDDCPVRLKVLKPGETFNLWVLVKKSHVSLDMLSNHNEYFYSHAIINTAYFEAEDSQTFLRALTNYDLVKEKELIVSWLFYLGGKGITRLILPDRWLNTEKRRFIVFDMNRPELVFEKDCLTIKADSKPFSIADNIFCNKNIKSQTNTFCLTNSAIGK